MKLLENIVKWTLIVLFFPLSLLVVAYFRQKKAKEEYFKDDDIFML